MLMTPEDEARRLLDVEFFLQDVVQEHGFDIHMVHCPFTGSMGKQQPNGFKPCHRGEDLIEVDSLALHVDLCDELGFVLGDDPDDILLYLVDPFHADWPGE